MCVERIFTRFPAYRSGTEEGTEDLPCELGDCGKDAFVILLNDFGLA